MKHLLTAIACCLAVAGSAQFPYNPDSNSDNIIGVEDLMGVLSLFGGPFFSNGEELQVQYYSQSDVALWYGEIDSLSIDSETDIFIMDDPTNTTSTTLWLPTDSSFHALMVMSHGNNALVGRIGPIGNYGSEVVGYLMPPVPQSGFKIIVRTPDGQWWLPLMM